MTEKKKLSKETEKSDNEQITTWHCDTYCRKVRHVSCEGETGINPDSPNRCPYLDEMLY